MQIFLAVIVAIVHNAIAIPFESRSPANILEKRGGCTEIACPDGTCPSHCGVCNRGMCTEKNPVEMVHNPPNEGSQDIFSQVKSFIQYLHNEIQPLGVGLAMLTLNVDNWKAKALCYYSILKGGNRPRKDLSLLIEVSTLDHLVRTSLPLVEYYLQISWAINLAQVVDGTASLQLVKLKKHMEEMMDRVFEMRKVLVSYLNSLSPTQNVNMAI